MFAFEKGSTIMGSRDPGNCIEAYIVEKNTKVKAGELTFMDDESLHKIVLDLFFGGIQTSSTTIYWFVMYMLNFPDVQEKVYNEIKEVVGTDKLPTMLDRAKMPYLNAAILETQRLASISPLSLMHMCSEDTPLRGYTIPKGVFIIPNLDFVLHDKTTWGEDAMIFKPERFLDANGKLKEREEFIPYGIGKRICLAEALAKMELFLFVSSMLQRFQFVPKDKAPPDCYAYNPGMVCTARHYEVRMLERK